MTNLEILTKHGFEFSNAITENEYDGHVLQEGSVYIVVHDGWNAAQAVSNDSKSFVGGVYDDTDYCIMHLEGDGLEATILASLAKAAEYNKAVAEAKAK